MAMKYDVTGVITEASNDCGVVSVTIDGERRLLPFSKTMLYTFGVQCDGSMSNLLEEGMDVDVAYSISDSGRKLCLLAVWLGDKPEIDQEDDTGTVYDQSGRVSRFVDSEWILVEADVNIMINKEDVFRNGERVENFGGISIGEEISFDAVPYDDGVYAATCAWIGPIKPRLVDRFNMRSKDENPADPDFDLSAGNGVHGTVAVIPNDAVAIVEVKTDSKVVDVLLFRSSFASRSERIHDTVEVGDRLFMRLRRGRIFSGRWQWIAVSALKVSIDVTVHEEQDVNSEESVSGESVACDETLQDGCGEAVGNEDADKIIGDESALPENKTKVTEVGSSIVETESKLVENGSSLMETVEDHVSDASVGDVTDSLNDDPKVYFHKHSSVLYSDPPLCGIISRFAFDAGCISYEELKIFVDRENFYVGGVRATVEQFMECVLPGTNSVSFEALKTIRPDAEKHGFTHDAICVWIGQKPTVTAVATSLPPAKLEWLKEKEEVFLGVAKKYHLPRSILIVVPGEPGTAVVDIIAFTHPIPLHKSHGVPGESLITNHVKLGEYVKFRPKKESDFPNLVFGYKASVAHLTYRTWNRIKLGHKTSRLKKPDEPENLKVGTPSGSVVKPTRGTSQVFDAEPFRGSTRCVKPAYLLNCQGILNSEDDVIVVEHALGSIVVNDDTVVYGHNVTVVTYLVEWRRQIVCFDAVSTDRKGNFCVERMWDPEVTGTRPPAECVLSQIDCPTSATFVPKLHHGKISSIPLRDCAIATVKGVPVLVTLKALVTFEEVANYSSIYELLSVGDDVAVNVEKRVLPGENPGKFCKAISCWKLNLEGGEFRANDKIENPEPEISSWFNVWGFGEHYRRERVINKNNRYFVNFMSSKRPNVKLRLDLFEKDCVFVNGNAANQEMMKSYIGHDITFHVAHDHSKNLLDFTSNGMFVACAWIGDEPSPKAVLKDRLSVPSGLVSDLRYEAVVKDFPLPMYAISYVGVLPVLVPLSKIEENGKFVGVLEENLKSGDRILLRIAEEEFEDTPILISDNPYTHPGKLEQCVLRYVVGLVTETPNPTGTIQAVNSDIMVRFELCHVRTVENNDMDTIVCLKDELVVGKEVIFSAIKVNSMSFCVLEVIVNSELYDDI